MSEATRDGEGLSIGELSKASGVPVNTLRTWERRYGFPASLRRPSGHRRYPPETVARLGTMIRLMNQGRRPAAVLAANDAELNELLDHSEQGEALGTLWGTWLASLESFDAARFRRQLQTQWHLRGTTSFLEDLLTPFLNRLGMEWAVGAVSIAEEHLASAVVTDFLSEIWRGLSERNEGPMAVLATPPGEHHVLGLHMGATVLALAGWRVVYLGASTPAAEIARAVNRLGARAVVLSASELCDRPALDLELDSLREAVPGECGLWIGGAGAPRSHPGVEFFEGFGALFDRSRLGLPTD